MNIANDMIRLWQNPQPEEVAETVEGFLHQLGGPTCLLLSGNQPQRRCRAITTLLHGNEPSGVIAVHRLLREGISPDRPLLIFIASVKAALAPPMFSHRALPDFRDLNRCFRAPFHDSQGLLAYHWIELLQQHRPEAMVDVHNTSGAGPSFAVAINEDRRHSALAALFTHRMIITDLRLGALMEISEEVVPTVTIECGGAQDEESHAVAYEGLLRFIHGEDLFVREDLWPVEILHHPVRLEVIVDAELVYREQIRRGEDICLLPEVERYNFGVVDTDVQLGWLGGRGMATLIARRADGSDVLHELFEMREGALYPARRLMLFMITGNAEIAKSDCILYAVAV